MSYNPNIHHRKSIRLKGYDYSQAGLYFITICCQDRAHLFGEIENGEMILNEYGKIANQCWLEIPNHFPNAILHEHIIMPNHIHGIVELVGANQYSPLPMTNNVSNDGMKNVSNDGMKNVSNDGMKNVSNDGMKNVSNDGVNNVLYGIGANNVLYGIGVNNDSPQRSPSKTIGSIVRGFKIGVTKWMRQNTNVYNVWQRNYYENIIRNENAYQRISQYIINNPQNWDNDSLK
jgi:putative transposase